MVQLHAQVTVTGRVLDTEDVPLIGANVVLRSDNTIGTITDLDGNFSLELNSESDSLQFSYAGYDTRVLAIGSRREFIVRMRVNSTLLDEIVVVGYGTSRKRDLIGAVDQIGSKEIGKMAVSSFDLAMQGQVAGVQLRQGTGQPGAGPEILIRGIGSISAGNQPLLVIDGMPYGNYNAQTNNFLAMLNPDDIESISVVRDASGKAIYGSRAANGLILVKTKRGRSGKPTISLNTYAGLQSIPPWEKPDILNATQLAQFLRERIEDAALVNGTDPNIPDYLEDPSVYGEGTDWFDAMTRNAWMQNTGLSISGGSDNFRYNLSLNYFNQDGTVIETNLKRYAFRANIDADITDWLHFGMELAPSWTDNQSGDTDPGGGQFSVYNTINVAQWADPTAPLFDENGNLPPTTRGELLPFFQANPVYKLRNENVQRDNRQLLTGFNLKLDLLEGLYFKTYFGAVHINNANRNYSPGSVVGDGLTPNNPDPPSNSFASAGRYENLRLITENTLNFDRQFGESGQHSVSAILGYIAEKSTETSFSASGSRLIDETFQFFNSGNIATNLPTNPEETRIFFNASEGRTEQALISYVGRVQYNFKSKYYLTAAVRSDGSSRFGPNNRYATFPSVGIAYRISEEPWFPKQKSLSNLRFEASWGKSGNNRIGNYAWQGIIQQNADYVIGGGRAEGAYLGDIPNPSLSWEETEQIDIGIDVGLFSDKLNIELDYYNQRTEGLIYAVPLPRITGYGSFTTNLGAIRNWGVELSINTRPVSSKDFFWSVDGNLSVNRNKVLQLGADDLTIRGTFAGNGTPVSWTEVGQPAAQFYGLEILGLYTPELLNDETIPKYPGAVEGSPYYTDGDGDGVLEGFEDYVFIGDPWPDFTFGLTNTFTYKDLELRVVMSGEVGSKILDLQREFMLNTDGVFNVRTEVLNRWRPGSTDYSLRPPTTTSVPSSQRYRWPNTLGVINGSFLKVNNVTLTYNMSSLLSKVKTIQGASVYVSVQNALVFSEFQGNPEVRRAATGSLERNINYGSYPVPRTFTFGLNLKL